VHVLSVLFYRPVPVLTSSSVESCHYHLSLFYHHNMIDSRRCYQLSAALVSVSAAWHRVSSHHGTLTRVRCHASTRCHDVFCGRWCLRTTAECERPSVPDTTGTRVAPSRRTSCPYHSSIINTTLQRTDATHTLSANSPTVR